MFKHSEPLKGKKDKYVNGYGSESEEEAKSVNSSNEDLFQDLNNMVKNIEKDLEKIESEIEKINNEIDKEETTIENMEGSGDYVAWQSIKSFLENKLDYYKNRSLSYQKMIQTLEDLEKKSEKDLKEAKQEYNDLTNQGFIATETESEDEADEEKIKELSDKIKDLQEGLDKIKIELPLLKNKVEKVYHQLEIDIKEMLQRYHKTPSSTLTEPNRNAEAQRDDLHKLLSLAGHHYTDETIAEISDDGKKARRTLSQIIIESAGVKKLKETDFIKNEDAYRNETFFQEYILGIKDPKIDINTFLNTDEFYRTADFTVGNKIYELKTITRKDDRGHKRRELQYYVPVKKIKEILDSGKDAELYWYVEPEKGWLSTKTRKDIGSKDYKADLYKLVLKPDTFKKEDIVKILPGQLINQKTYMIREGDPRITKA